MSNGWNRRRPCVLTSKPGLQIPVHCSASGKLLMAYAPNTLRERFLAEAPFHAYTKSTITTARALARELDTSANGTTQKTIRNSSQASTASPCRCATTRELSSPDWPSWRRKRLCRLPRRENTSRISATAPRRSRNSLGGSFSAAIQSADAGERPDVRRVEVVSRRVIEKGIKRAKAEAAERS